MPIKVSNAAMDIQVLMARNYIDNLKEEVGKGMREKAEQGIYPSRPPLGYMNNVSERTIEVDSKNAPIVKRMCELYGTGEHSRPICEKKFLENSASRSRRDIFTSFLEIRFITEYSSGAAPYIAELKIGLLVLRCSNRCSQFCRVIIVPNIGTTNSPLADC